MSARDTSRTTANHCEVAQDAIAMLGRNVASTRLVMRSVVLCFIAILTARTRAQAQTVTSSVAYSTPDRGGIVLETAGGNAPIVVGYARVEPSASTTPAGLAIVDSRQNGVLAAEAGIAGTSTLVSGRTYAEISGSVNTAIAFENPNGSSVTISFSFTDQNGNNFGQRNFVLDGNQLAAKFLNEAPFSAPRFAGTFSFDATAPVAAVALRTFVNERGEFLFIPQTIASIPDPFSTGTVVMGHFADGAGWKTRLSLVNTTDVQISGTVQFFGEGAPDTAAVPVNLNVNGQLAASFPYSIPARASLKLETLGAVTAAIQLGSVRITPDSGSTAPSVSALLSLSRNGITVSQVTLRTQPAGLAFRTYVEVNSSAAAAGTIQSGFAITNNSVASTTVNFELTSLDGTNTGLTAGLVVPGSGHVSKFVHELFPTLSLPFRGILRVSSTTSIVVVSLRLRYNERGDLLMTPVPVTNEGAPSTTAEIVFPIVVDRAGFTTQFVLFSGITGQRTAGTMEFFGPDGQPMNLTIR